MEHTGARRQRLRIAQAEHIAFADHQTAAGRAKNEFLASMSHELRTPLHAIIGFSELIREQAPRPGTATQVAEFATDILASGRHLQELINTVLDLSKVESGTALLTESIVSMADIVKLVEGNEAPAKKRGSYKPRAPKISD